jgi:hypothetical protein
LGFPASLFTIFYLNSPLPELEKRELETADAQGEMKRKAWIWDDERSELRGQLADRSPARHAILWKPDA